MTLRELRKKDVIQVEDGENLGRVDDLEFDPQTSEMQAMILYGHQPLLGIGKSQPDLVVEWNEINSFGKDVIMVSTKPTEQWQKPNRKWRHLLG